MDTEHMMNMQGGGTYVPTETGGHQVQVPSEALHAASADERPGHGVLPGARHGHRAYDEHAGHAPAVSLREGSTLPVQNALAASRPVRRAGCGALQRRLEGGLA